MEFSLKEIHDLESRLDLFPLYSQLNPALKFEWYKERTECLMQEPNYHLLGIFHGNTCIGMSGYWISHKLYCGKYLEPDNVVMDSQWRGKGVGHILQQELERIAQQNECRVMMLDAYLENLDGHRFYESKGYEKKGFHFIKKL
ncbi:MAG: GNAT family N-acetyltransferase [Bacteroidia bacterium]|jgi:GNAT superfamily N-acetyltransferase